MKLSREADLQSKERVEEQIGKAEQSCRLAAELLSREDSLAKEWEKAGL
nr:hypothetical protein [Sulfolobus islandicus]